MVEEQGTVASAWLVAVPFNPEQKIGNIGSPFGNWFAEEMVDLGLRKQHSPILW